jgi:signal transduction histidine kinase/ligand-binding sensor domain-containing protein
MPERGATKSLFRGSPSLRHARRHTFTVEIEDPMTTPGKALLICLALLHWGMPGRALALDPQRSLDQLHHTAWTIRDGAPPDIWALAQSSDGYLWLGTGAGLFRFDGVRFEKFRPRSGDTMPSSNINALYADPSGDLWIGYDNGYIARLRAGRLSTFAVRGPDAAVAQIVPGHDGTLWAVLYALQRGGLERYANGRWNIVGADWGLPAGSINNILVDRTGTLWVAVGKTLAILPPGAQRFHVVDAASRAYLRVVEAPTGEVWVLTDGDTPVPKSVAGHLLRRLPATVPRMERLVFDRDGGLWGTRGDGGIIRIRSVEEASTAPAQTLTLKDGLSSNLAVPILEDREGNVWVGSNLGLDRFRATNAVAAPGVSNTSRHGFQASPGEDGSVYVTTGTTLLRAYADRPAKLLAQLPSLPRFLITDRTHGVWLGTDGGIRRLRAAGLDTVNLPPGANGRILSGLEDRGGVCFSVLDKGIFCDADGRWTSQAPRLGAVSIAPVQMASDVKGRWWLNYENHLAMVEGGRTQAFSTHNGLNVGNISIVAPERSAVFVGGDFGLARFDGQRFQTLSSVQQPMLSRISGIVQARSGALWLNTIGGVVEIAPKALAEAFEHPERPLRARIFNLEDGMPGVAQQDSHSTTALEASDGRLWFVTSHGVAWIDPHHLAVNPLMPPVAIRALIASGKEYSAGQTLALPAGTSNIEIDYAALSLSIPERVRFRYRMDGVDADWVDPGMRRQAFYTVLGPGTYRFRVIAANNDGVWNRTGATLIFHIAPTFLQSLWFKALVALAVLAGLWMLYSARLRQITGRMQLRLDERLGERERIARELHDTLLQGFQGLLYRFQAIHDQLPGNLAVRTAMEQALDRADQALADGRDRVSDLRATAASDDLSQTFIASATQAAGDFAGDFRVIVEGRVRPLHPIVREEIARIGEEAIANALQHAQADTIEVSIAYDKRQFRVHFRDDGVGVPDGILARGGRQRHFGLTGMRERAEAVRGTFAIASRAGNGTEITLSVPASVAYSALSDRRWRLFRRKPLFEG